MSALRDRLRERLHGLLLLLERGSHLLLETLLRVGLELGLRLTQRLVDLCELPLDLLLDLEEHGGQGSFSMLYLGCE